MNNLLLTVDRYPMPLVLLNPFPSQSLVMVHRNIQKNNFWMSSTRISTWGPEKSSSKFMLNVNFHCLRWCDIHPNLWLCINTFGILFTGNWTWGHQFTKRQHAMDILDVQISHGRYPRSLSYKFPRVQSPCVIDF